MKMGKLTPQSSQGAGERHFIRSLEIRGLQEIQTILLGVNWIGAYPDLSAVQTSSSRCPVTKQKNQEF